ncbi:ABC transporter substrate-binding protein [Canibacter zhoujuaniae]|uniref:ABC transporter substrate-binding protein n=1 Tax=Canibacter zhoujuaniae TaxID=2708343 RepID=UPI00142334F2|nr:ABC transporter substrate-binding protein [Canibacter zhoujuaniae]
MASFSAKLSRIAAIAALGAVVMSGCATAGGDTADRATGNEKLVWAIAGGNLENNHMDPHRSQLDVSAIVGRLVLDSLTYLDEKGELQPWLATDWSVSEDGKSVSFDLRHDVTFHDGEAFNAAAVKANFDHIMAEETESAAASDLLGGDVYSETVVIDDDTVEVRFTQPFAPFLINTSTANLGMYSPKALAASAEKLPVGGPGVSVGTGPWVMTEITPGASISYERNADYNWYPEGVKAADKTASNLEVQIVPEQQVRVQRVESGEADVASELQPNGLDGLTSEVVLNENPGMPYSVFLNTSNPILADVKVRQALALSADIDAIVASTFQGNLQPATGVLSQATPAIGAAADKDYTNFDETKAAALLDEAGWVQNNPGEIREKNGEKLSLDWYRWTEQPVERETISTFLADGWRKLGVEVNIHVLEGEQYNKFYGTPEMALTDWGYSSADPDILRNHLHSAGFQNIVSVADPELDAKLTAATANFDAEKRGEIYSEVIRTAADEAYIIPVFNTAFINVVGKNTAGFAVDGYGFPVFFNTSKA